MLNHDLRVIPYPLFPPWATNLLAANLTFLVHITVDPRPLELPLRTSSVWSDRLITVKRVHTISISPAYAEVFMRPTASTIVTLFSAVKPSKAFLRGPDIPG